MQYNVIILCYGFVMINNKYVTVVFLTVFLFTSQKQIHPENPDTTLKKINKNINLIKTASEKFDTDYKILCAIIYVERTLNYDWEDNALDEILANAGLNSSIGFCQVKMKTAYWIEKKLIDLPAGQAGSNSIFYPGNKFKSIIKLSKSPKEIILKLKNDSLNILYASAYIKIIINRWRKAGFPINENPEIIGTLYSTGLFYATGEERKPNKNPKANEFGEKVKEAVKLFKD